MGRDPVKEAKIDLKNLKAGGFIKQNQADYFIIRIRVLAGNISPKQLSKVADLADKYGQGKLHFSVRQGIEIPYVLLEDLDSIKGGLASVGLKMGSCGPRVRVIVACPGNSVCRRGLGDTQELTKRLDEKFYGRDNLPHKFKMAVTGCPSSCAKPQENDVGFVGVAEPILDESEGECIDCGLCEINCPTGALKLVDGKPIIDGKKCYHDGRCILVCPTEVLVTGKSGWDIYVGGKFGREPKLGLLLKEFITDDDALPLVEKILSGYVSLGKKGERLRETIDRVDFDKFKKEVLGG